MDWLKLSVALLMLKWSALTSAEFDSKVREHLPVSLLVIPSGKGLLVAGPELQVGSQ